MNKKKTFSGVLIHIIPEATNVKQISAGSHLKDTNADLRYPTSYEVTDALKQQQKTEQSAVLIVSS